MTGNLFVRVSMRKMLILQTDAHVNHYRYRNPENGNMLHAQK